MLNVCLFLVINSTYLKYLTNLKKCKFFLIHHHVCISNSFFIETIEA